MSQLLFPFLCLFFLLQPFAKNSLLASDVMEPTENSVTPTVNEDHHPSKKIKIPLVTVGDPGNDPDLSNGLGAVEEPFQMGKYDVTVKEYCAFLNAVATTADPYELYSENMGSEAPYSIIKKEGPNGCHYEAVKKNENLPITFVTWLSAARFCNWLHNDQPVGEEGASTTETGAYNLNGTMWVDLFTDTSFLAPQPGARFFLPTADQWYKAAFYKGNGRQSGYWLYPTQHNNPPGNTVNSWFYRDNQMNFSAPYYFLGYYSRYYSSEEIFGPTPVGAFKETTSSYGLYDMGGNVEQWTTALLSNPRIHDEATELVPAYYGGSWKTHAISSNDYYATRSSQEQGAHHSDFTLAYKSNTVGFRVAAPPVIKPPTLSFQLTEASTPVSLDQLNSLSSDTSSAVTSDKNSSSPLWKGLKISGEVLASIITLLVLEGILVKNPMIFTWLARAAGRNSLTGMTLGSLKKCLRTSSKFDLKPFYDFLYHRGWRSLYLGQS